MTNRDFMARVIAKLRAEEWARDSLIIEALDDVGRYESTSGVLIRAFLETQQEF